MTIAGIIAIAVFLASFMLSQRVALNAGTRLDDATKLKLMEIFPKRNFNYTLIVFGIVLVFLIAVYALPQYVFVIATSYGIALAIYLFVKLFLNIRKLKEVGAPEEYVRSIILSFGVFIGGAVAAAIIFATIHSLGR